jgi:hypothetical protein
VKALAVAAALVAAGCLDYDALSRNANCHDGTRNGDESDVDCGGSCRAKCRAWRRCTVAADCAGAACVAGRCEEADGPPSWRPVASLPAMHSRTGLGAATGTDGRLYAVGGTGDDPAGVQVDSGLPWMGEMPLQLGRRDLAVVAAPDSLFAIAGTSLANGSPETTRVERFTATPQTARGWSDAPALREARSHSAAVVLPVDQTRYDLFVFGGPTASHLVEVLIDAQKPTVGWTVAGTNGRADLAAVVAPNDPKSILLFGGCTLTVPELAACGGPSAMAELEVDVYASDTSQLAGTLAPLPAGHVGLAGVVGNDGRVYAIGGTATAGASNATATARVDAYDPTLDAWVQVAPLGTARTSFGATLGPDGRLYAIAGLSATHNALGTVEAYGPTATTTVGSDGTVVLGGDNFAADAAVTVSSGGQPIAAGRTASNGGLAGIAFPIPAGCAPPGCTVTVVDDASGYPAPAFVPLH